MKLDTALISNKGGRKINQDFADFVLSDNGGCWALADGLGGHLAGEVASRLAVETILEIYKENTSLDWLKKGINDIQAVLQLQQKTSVTKKSMRTTIVVLVCQNNTATWAHVGDSRLYHFRNGRLNSQTKDHSVCQALVNAGIITTNQIRFHEDRNRLIRVLGSDESVKATFLNEEVMLLPEDAFLLCSDGFWEYITEEEMESTRASAHSAKEWLKQMEELLKQRFVENHDNYSALAVIVENK